MPISQEAMNASSAPTLRFGQLISFETYKVFTKQADGSSTVSTYSHDEIMAKYGSPQVFKAATRGLIEAQFTVDDSSFNPNSQKPFTFRANMVDREKTTNEFGETVFAPSDWTKLRESGLKLGGIKTTTPGQPVAYENCIPEDGTWVAVQLVPQTRQPDFSTGVWHTWFGDEAACVSAWANYAGVSIVAAPELTDEQVTLLKELWAGLGYDPTTDNGAQMAGASEVFASLIKSHETELPSVTIEQAIIAIGVSPAF